MNPRVSVPKIFLRGNKWYVRVQVPKSMQERLKRKEYWVSLRTSDRAEALQHATAATQKKRREISAVYRRLSSIKETFHELNADQQLALGREAYATHVSGNADLIAEFKASNFETLKAFTEARSDTVDDVIARLLLARSDTPHIRIMAYKLMEENDIRLPEGSVAFQQLLEICADTFIEAKRNELAKLAGRAVHDAPNPQYVDTVTGGPKSYVSLGDQLAVPPEPTPSLTALMEAFLDNPNKLRTVKTKKSIRGYLGVVFQILGDETPVDEITEADCERVRDLIARLPPNFMKLPGAGKHTIEELAALAERKGLNKLSPTGVNNYLRWLMTFLGWCHRKGKMDRMPTAYAEIKVADPVRKKDKRAAFSNDQLNVIFRSQVYQDHERNNSLFWVPLIALWNGMRSNEICQLDVADIKLEENVWGFDVTHISTTGDDDKSVKTGSSIRFVPMHPRLIKFGLLDFHGERPPNAKLFGDITRGSDGYYSTNFSKKVKQVLFKRLCQRNAIRREIGIRPMNVPALFKRRLRMMMEQRYIELFEPYLVAAFGSVEWPVEPTPRILLAVKQHQIAMDTLFRDIGVADPREKHADVTALIERLVPTSTTDTVVVIPSRTYTNAHQIEPGGR